MLRRKIFQGVGLIAVSGIAAPMVSYAGTSLASESILERFNKNRLLREIKSKFGFGNELVLTDVNQRAGQLYISVKHRDFRFNLRSPDHGARWYTA